MKKKYRVLTGFSDSWRVIVEAESEEEAKREGKRRFLELLDEPDAFYAIEQQPPRHEGSRHE